ncbi:MAG: ABC transporter ATP-binding protein [Oligoflexales bacterium]
MTYDSRPAIEVEGVSRSYGDVLAVDNVQFSIPRGQIVGLLGHNGAGKTTTIKMMTGFLEPSHGTIKVNGLRVDEHSLEVQQKIGYLPEHSPLYPEMTVVEYLAFVARIRNVPAPQIQSAVLEAMKSTDLASKMHAKIQTLSKGFRQRVGVAQAIVHKPDILILDEPTSGLDPAQISAMRDLIKSLAKHSTILLSTHIMQEVEAICDRVIIIMQGHVAVDSMLQDLQKSHDLTMLLKQPSSEVSPFLSEMPGVEDVSLVSEHDGFYRYAIRSTEVGRRDLAPNLVRKVTEKGWDLYQVAPEVRDLETVFRDVNSGKGNHYA